MIWEHRIVAIAADCKSALIRVHRFESFCSHYCFWELGVDGLTRKIEALEAGVRLPEVPLNFIDMTTLKLWCKGSEVKTLQSKLNLIADGIFGPITEEAVKDFQKKNGLTVDGIVGPNTWAKLGVTQSRYINEIIVHCSATAEGKDFTVADIKKWHLARGFSDVGYHYVIYRDGSINKGRDESKIGAHCTGHNSYSIGVCYIGGCAADGKTPKDTRTDAQKKALLELLRELKKKYPKASIHSHRDYANKACPSFDATKEYKNI